ncbi:MAG: hypothetical protein F7B18_06780 [Desulfurococcales archaeon]|nr:hypothetical protein [Desulfurococcales archaeon]
MRRRRSRRGNDRLRDLVRQSMARLYRIAQQEARRGRLDRASRIGWEIWRLHVETRVRMPRWMKRGLCRRCKAPLIPGVTARVRTRSQGCLAYKTVTCLHCGWIHRYPYRRRCKGGRPKGEGEEEVPLQARRDHREERANPRGNRGDKEEARQGGGGQGKDA